MIKNEKSDLILPIILWGSEPPKHQISQIIVIQNGDIIVTGSTEGQIIQWKVESNGIEPNMMVFGHEAAITCLAPTSASPSTTKYISCCRKGQICLWDSSDGSCIESVKHPLIHRKIIPYTFQISSTQTSSQLYCIGDYADIVVIDPNDLNILFTFNSRIDPDWINALTIIKRQNLHDAIIGISISGMIKVWSFANITKCDSNGIYEDEAKSLPIKNVKTISQSLLNPKIMLIVASSSWQILDLNNFNPLIISECTIEALDGVIIDGDKIAVGFIDGTIALFQLPKHRLSGAGNIGSAKNDYPFVFGLLKNIGSSFTNNVNFFFNTRTMVDKSNQIFAYRADENANISAFKIPENLNVLASEVQQTKKPALIEPTLKQSLEKVWKGNKLALPGIFNTDMLKYG
uniref:Uncharacterized protein n=1 Tax=Panagrolaimus davidi TaxID=227884 RepID=A0A914PXQ0_9BILA